MPEKPLPKNIFRVSYTEMVGWPDADPNTLQFKKRVYDDSDDASRFVATIRGFPTHMTLLGVWHGVVEWTPIPDAWIPDPKPHIAHVPANEF